MEDYKQQYRSILETIYKEHSRSIDLEQLSLYTNIPFPILHQRLAYLEEGKYIVLKIRQVGTRIFSTVRLTAKGIDTIDNNIVNSIINQSISTPFIVFTLRFLTDIDVTRVIFEADVIGRRESIFHTPYNLNDLRLMIKALDAVQYPDYPSVGPQFSEDEKNTLIDLNLWSDSRVSSDAYKIVGQALYEGLDHGGKSAIKEVVNYSISQNLRISYVLRFSEDAVMLAALPWELISDQKQAILLSRGNDIDSCERYMDIDQALRPSVLRDEQLHVLALLPNYNISSQVRMEEQAVREASWNKLRDMGRISYSVINPLTRRALSEYLRSAAQSPDIVHYFGHGSYRDGEGYLIFDNGHGGKDTVSAAELAGVLGKARLVVLHACQSAMSIEEDGGLFTGVAPALSRVVDAVVAMQFTVRTDVATRFAEVFYEGLLIKGLSVQESVAEGRQALFFEFGRHANWYVPTLHIRSRKQEPLFLVHYKA